MDSTRLAVVDIGSNAVRLLIGEVGSNHRGVTVLFEAREVVRLGSDTFQYGYIRTKKIDQLQATLGRFREYVAHHDVDRCLVVATSAMREAENGLGIVEMLRSQGWDICLIDGEEEARLELDACVQHGYVPNGWSTMLAIGGGSTQIVSVIDAFPYRIASVEFGTLRLLNWLQEKRLPDSCAIEAVRQHAHLIHMALPTRRPKVGVAVGGNPRAIGKIKQQLLDGSDRQLTLPQVQRIVEKLTRMTVAERQEQLGLKPQRADIIAIAACMLQHLMELSGLERVHLPHVGLRHGLLLRAARD